MRSFILDTKLLRTVVVFSFYRRNSCTGVENHLLTHYRELVKSGMSLIFVKYSAGIKMNVTMKVTGKTHLFL